MSNQYGGPWSNQPNEGAAPGPPVGWTQPGPAPTTPLPPGGSAPPPYPGPSGPYGLGQPTYGPPGYPPGPAGYGPQAYPVGYPMPLRTDYASWGKRVGAMLIDQIPSYVGMIIFCVGYVLWIVSLTQSTG